MAAVRNTDRAIVPVGRDVAGELGAGKTGNLGDVPLHDLFFGTFERQIFESDQRVANPARAVVPVKRLEGDGKRPVNEHPEIAEGLEKGIVKTHDHGGSEKSPPLFSLIFGEKEV